MKTKENETATTAILSNDNMLKLRLRKARKGISIKDQLQEAVKLYLEKREDGSNA